MIPIYDDSKRGRTIVRLGMIAYDALSWDRTLPGHQYLSASRVAETEPGLRKAGLRGAGIYYDAQAEFPERLTVENALAAHHHGAMVLTHARVDRLVVEDHILKALGFVDELDGSRHRVRARLAINAAGPWVDDVLKSARRPVKRLIGGTKGSHIVVDDFRGAPKDAIYVEAEDRRPYFIVPWRGQYLIGTTDLRYEGDLDQVSASEEEIDYLIRSTNRVFPDANLSRDRVLFSYAGVRPLPYKPEGEAGAIHRRHIFHDHRPAIDGLISVVGGKITSARALAEQAVDMVFERLGRKAPPCLTSKRPLPGADVDDFEAFSLAFTERSGLPAAAAERLLNIYGVRAKELVDSTRGDEDLLHPIGKHGLLGSEITFGLQFELAETLTDVLMRRAMVSLDPAGKVQAAREAAEIARRRLDWSKERADREVDDFVRTARRYGLLTGSEMVARR